MTKEQDNKPQSSSKGSGAATGQRPPAPTMQPPAPRPPGGMPSMTPPGFVSPAKPPLPKSEQKPEDGSKGDK